MFSSKAHKQMLLVLALVVSFLLIGCGGESPTKTVKKAVDAGQKASDTVSENLAAANGSQVLDACASTFVWGEDTTWDDAQLKTLRTAKVLREANGLDKGETPDELQTLMSLLIDEWKRQAREVLTRFGYSAPW